MKERGKYNAVRFFLDDRLEGWEFDLKWIQWNQKLFDVLIWQVCSSFIRRRQWCCLLWLIALSIELRSGCIHGACILTFICNQLNNPSFICLFRRLCCWWFGWSSYCSSLCRQSSSLEPLAMFMFVQILFLFQISGVLRNFVLFTCHFWFENF